jgi:hypothetical protein
MNEIVDILQQKAGLSPDQAQEVATAIVELDQVQSSDGVSGMVDQYLGGSGDAQAGSSGLARLADFSARLKGCSAARANLGPVATYRHNHYLLKSRPAVRPSNTT